eukprot:jgi/Botrbrau1/21732/Bobra.43_1s0126.1
MLAQAHLQRLVMAFSPYMGLNYPSVLSIQRRLNRKLFSLSCISSVLVCSVSLCSLDEPFFAIVNESFIHQSTTLNIFGSQMACQEPSTLDFADANPVRNFYNMFSLLFTCSNKHVYYCVPSVPFKRANQVAS